MSCASPTSCVPGITAAHREAEEAVAKWATYVRTLKEQHGLGNKVRACAVRAGTTSMGRPCMCMSKRETKRSRPPVEHHR